MAIYAESGIFNSIVGVVTPGAKLVSVVGNVYVASSSGGSTTIASSDGTISVTGTTQSYNITVAQQSATLNQVLSWNGTKWAPASVTGTGTVTNFSFGAPANNAFAVTNPTSTPTVNFQNVGATPATAFLRGDGQWATPPSGTGTVSSVTVGTTLSTALLFLTSTTTPVLNSQNVGVTPTTVFLRGDGTWASPPSGGGGGTFTGSAIWTGGTGNKNAYSAPLVINNVGITINLVASSGSGGITAAVVALNGVSLPNTYASTGTWPNLVITIPVADITGNAAQIANSVLISLTGTFGGSGVNIASAGMLTNTQPTFFTTTLSGSYAIASAPYYTTTATLNWTYSNTTGTVQAYGGTFTPGGSANTLTGSFANIAITGSTIGGVAIGTGLAGAGSRTINLSGSVASVPTFIPAFYVETPDATVPTFTTASSQTTGAAQGSVITYPLPVTSAYYNWICTQRPLARLMLRTPFGDSALVPDVTAPTQTIAGQVFSVYGYSGLSLLNASILVIT